MFLKKDKNANFTGYGISFEIKCFTKFSIEINFLQFITEKTLLIAHEDNNSTNLICLIKFIYNF